MRITTAHRYYSDTGNVGSNGIVIDTDRFLIDVYLTTHFKLSTAYTPADDFCGAGYLLWLGWLHIETTRNEVMEA